MKNNSPDSDDLAVLSRLTLASEFPDSLTWAYNGPCEVGPPIGDTRNITALWDGTGSGTVTDRDRGLWQLNYDSRYRERIKGVSLCAPNNNWRVPYAFAYSHQGDTTELHWWRMWQRLSGGTVDSTVLLVPTGATLAFPDPLPIVPGVVGRHFNENGLLSRVFNSALLVRSIQIGDAPHLAIAYEGLPLTEEQTISLLTVLGLLLGHDLKARAEITVDADGQTVDCTVFALRETPMGERRPAIHVYDAYSVRAASVRLHTMVERAYHLRFENDVAVDVAIKYLQRWHMGQLDLEIRDITSALNVLIESPAFAPSNTTLLDADTLERLYRNVEATLDEKRYDVPRDFRVRLRKRLNEVNSISMRERRDQFWSVIGFHPTARERLALERRHVMSHKGYIDPQDAAEERALLQDIETARTLVNETLLALLHYDGPLIAYGSGLRSMRTTL